MRAIIALSFGLLVIFSSSANAEAYRHFSCWSFYDSTTYFSQVMPESRSNKGYDEFVGYLLERHDVKIFEPHYKCKKTGVLGGYPDKREVAEESLRKAKEKIEARGQPVFQTAFPEER
jgi:hypothetical protein